MERDPTFSTPAISCKSCSLYWILATFIQPGPVCVSSYKFEQHATLNSVHTKYCAPSPALMFLLSVENLDKLYKYLLRLWSIAVNFVIFILTGKDYTINVIHMHILIKQVCVCCTYIYIYIYIYACVCLCVLEYLSNIQMGDETLQKKPILKWGCHQNTTKTPSHTYKRSSVTQTNTIQYTTPQPFLNTFPTINTNVITVTSILYK